MKFFVEADIETRAERRRKELQEKGIVLSFEKILEDLKKRDHIDKNREVSPLKPAEDAQIINSTSLSIEEKTEHALKVVQEAIKQS